MGTRGYRVYRYKNFYFVIYNQWDSYPDGLGVEIAYEIPRDSTAFEAYVTRISREPPQKGSLIDWMYEIDLDNYIFHVNGEPLFDLRHMPYGEHFVSYIGFDEYGRRSFHPKTPEEYRYKLPPPPPVDPLTLDAYKAYDVTCASPHEVLEIPLEKSAIEQTRIEIMQVFIAAAMRTMDNTIGLGINAVFSDTVAKAVSTRIENICRFFSGPLVLPESYLLTQLLNGRVKVHSSAMPFTWIKDHFGVLSVPRLDAETTLQAAIVELVGHAQSHLEDKKYVKGAVFYGAILSLYHVSIVRLEVVEAETRTFRLSHTPPLQFLPSDHPTDPSTPGIEALSRLGQMVFKRSLTQMFASRSAVYHKSPSISAIGTLPPEIHMSIAQYLPPNALLAFASISRSTTSISDTDNIPAELDLIGKSLYASSFSAVTIESDRHQEHEVAVLLYANFRTVQNALEKLQKDIIHEFIIDSGLGELGVCVVPL
ncbi:hypothetical protein BT96DRAFT_1013212 [Gymnopus androsaceus JB14]|uniref:F-box domain-containing protein n=1 Tax=Gymnopus androsaceus JB14 TaxID=1447944 RepID=A0A6A4IDC7_9AGAR|nr:hypothetical protein BT96DRAFT_1013212 [Gymnopus androsaceus JB14]